MNSWAERMLAELTAKKIELEQQLDGVDAAISALRRGYDLPIMGLPNIITGPQLGGEEKEK